MTWRWSFSVAALVSLAIVCLVWGSSAPRAGETATLRVAGAAEDDAATAKDGGETEAASPQEATDDGEAAAPATDSEEEETSPAGDAAEPKDGAAADKPDAAGTDAASPEKDGKDAEAKPESKDEEESKQAALESDAAAEKVKSGDIDVPSDKVALAAFNALEKNCSRCHQAGPTLKRAKPAKNFGNVLHLDELARDPNFVLPGNPDGSHLFIQIAKKEMPYDCYQEFDCKEEPSEAEVQAVYDWIKSLGDVALAACTGRKLIDAGDDRAGDRGRPRSAAGAPAQGHALHHAVEFLYGLRRRNRHGALPAGRGEAAQQPLAQLRRAEDAHDRS